MAGDRFIDPAPFPPELWEELIGDISPSGEQFTDRASVVRVAGQVDWEDSYSLILAAKGYSYTDSSNRLCRLNPLRHPYYSWLYCSAVTEGRGVQVDSASPKESYGVPGSLDSIAKYKKVRYTLEFSPLPPGMVLKEDSDVQVSGGGEWERNITVSTAPNIEFLTVKSGQILFNAPSISDLNGKTIASTQYIRIQKVKYVVKWHQVPKSYVMDGFNPVQIANAAGKVNDTEIFGFPRGTLLMLNEPVIEPYAAPLRVGDEEEDVYYVDISLPMLFFDPPNGIPSPDTGHDIRGHNLFPASYGGAYVGKFYPGVFSRTGSPPVFEYYEFRNIFRHHSEV